MPAGLIHVGAASEVPANGGRAFQAGDFSVLVCKTREGWFAVENVCSHQLQALEGGRIRGCFIFCPLHGQRFDLRSGAPIGQLTDKPLRIFDVAIEAAEIYVSPSPRVVQD